MKRSTTLLAFALAASSVLHAQSTFASITGVTSDASGAPVPGASIAVTNEGTGYKYNATSGSNGQYTVPNLIEGRYSLVATAPGFAEFRITEIVLTTRDIRRIDVAFQVSQVQTSVEVSAGVTLIETETARVADVKVRQTMIDMPLSLRRSWDFIQQSPNVSKTKSGFNMRFGGSRVKQGDVSVDGVTISNVFGGQITGVVSDRTESYQEMRLEMAGGVAENQGVGQLSVVTRSGTNDLHGEAFNYYTSPGLGARNPFAAANTASIEWVPGGSIGGPVYIPKIYNGKDRTFFFSSIEFERFGPPSLQLFNPTVPLPSWRRGDFSGLLPGTVIRDPFGGNAPFAGNQLPSSRMAPAAVKLQDTFYPLPNFGSADTLVAQNHRVNLENPKLINPTFVTRIDHRLNEKVFLNGRFTIVRWPQQPFVGSLPTIGRTDRTRKSNTASFAYAHTIKPTLLSEFRWGFATDAFPETPPQRGAQVVRDLGFQGLAPNLPDVGGLPTINFTNINLTNISNSVQCNPCINYGKHNFQENVTWFRNAHSLKFGALVTRGSYLDLRQGGGLFGNITFSNRFTNHPYADFLLGVPTTMARNFPALAQDTLAWTYGFFAQDDWKVTPRLTLSYGLRYEIKPGFTARDGLQSVFDVGSGRIIIPDGALGRVSPLMPRGYVPVVEAGQAGYAAQTLIKTDWNNLAPRFGFAWRPFGNDTVIRGGYGVYYDIVARNASLSTVPFNIAEPAYTNSLDNPLRLPTVFPQSVAGPGTVSIPGAINPNLQIPYSMQYSFTLEHQRWDTGFRASYIGTNTRQGVWAYNYNQPVPDTRAFVDKPRPFPNYPAINYVTNGAGHQYHAATVEVERQLKGGLRAQFYYTLARDIGDLEDGETAENAFDRRRERAVWSDIPTHRVHANFLYQLPFGKGRPLLAGAGRAVNTLVSGWQLGGIYTWQTGDFLTPTWTGADPTGTRFTANRTPANVTLRPDHLRDGNIDDPAPARWFDGSAFAAPAAGRFGTSAKGVIIGPGVNTFHANLAKVTTIRDRFRIRTELVATNVANHPNYVDPNMNITDVAGVGVIGNVVNRNSKMDMAIPRVLQLVLRLQW